METFTFSSEFSLKVTSVEKPNPTQEIIIALVELFKFLLKD
jgi:hypothetical protein